MNNNYCVYMHVNKINQKKYIGITRQDPLKRWRNGNGYSTQPFFNAIKRYKWDNFEHVILYEKLNYKQACKYEKELIAEYRTTDSRYGYNCSDGGEDCISYYNHLVHNNKMVYQYTLNGKLINIYESVNEAVQSLNIDNVYAGTNISSAARENGKSKSAYGYIWSYEYLGKSTEAYDLCDAYGAQNRIKIYQYDLDGKFLCEFQSIKEASDLLNVSMQSIACILDQEHRTSCNYQWRTFLKENGIEPYSPIPNRNYNLKKKIVRISKNDLSIKIYDGLSDARDDMGLENTHCISSVLSKSRPSVYGYYWFYYSEYKDGSWKTYINHYRTQRTVYIYNEDFNEYTYDSLQSLCDSCEKDFGIKFGKSSVCNVCNGKERIHKNHIFSYIKLTKDELSRRFNQKNCLKHHLKEEISKNNNTYKVTCSKKDMIIPL